MRVGILEVMRSNLNNGVVEVLNKKLRRDLIDLIGLRRVSISI